MTWGNSKWIRNFNRNGNLLKWIYNNRFMNLSAVIIYSIVDSIILAFSSSLRPFDRKRRVSTISESFLSSKSRLMLRKSFSLNWVIWAVEKEVNSYFNLPTAVAECVWGALKIVFKLLTQVVLSATLNLVSS